MADKESKPTGLSKYFNNYTIAGRANVSKATLLSLFTFWIVRKILIGMQSVVRTLIAPNSNVKRVTLISLFAFWVTRKALIASGMYDPTAGKDKPKSE